MVRDIFVISMCVIAVGAGIWCWWVERHGSDVSDTPTDSTTTISEKSNEE